MTKKTNNIRLKNEDELDKFMNQDQYAEELGIPEEETGNYGIISESEELHDIEKGTALRTYIIHDYKTKKHYRLISSYTYCGEDWDFPETAVEVEEKKRIEYYWVATDGSDD